MNNTLKCTVNYQMGTEAVINEVRDQECLWNPNDEGYKIKCEKVLAWQHVCTKVAPNYSTATKRDKREIEKAVQLRWKTARDAYVKCKSQMKNPAFKNKKPYMFYDALTFLDRVRDSGAEDGSDESLPETSAQNNDQPDPLEIEKVAESSRAIPRRRFQRKRMRTMDSFESRLLRTIQNNIHPPAVSNSTQTLLQDDDQAFFNSLAPILNNFDNYKKLIFRSRILKVAMDIADTQRDRRQIEENIKQDIDDNYFEES